MDIDDDALERRTARATLVTRAFVIVAVVLAAAIYYQLLTVSADTNRIVSGVEAQQDTNTGTLNASERGLELIRDCTEPGGECYGRSQRRTADAVADINLAAVYAAACADREGVQGEDEIYACVVRLFAERAEARAR